MTEVLIALLPLTLFVGFTWGHIKCRKEHERRGLKPLHIACGYSCGIDVKEPCDRREHHRGKHVATTDSHHHEATGWP